MRRLLALMLGLAGCDQVFSLDRPPDPSVPHFRKALTLRPLTGGHVDFPVAVVLDDADLAARATSGAIAFTTADGTRLAHEIEAFEGGRLAAWVRVPQLDTETTIYLHYGPLPAALAEELALGSVWRAEYTGVWHFAGTNLAEVLDSTIQGNDLEQLMPVRQPAIRADGILGPARQFDGDTLAQESDTLVARDQDSLDPGMNESFTYAVWVNVQSHVGPFDMPLFKGGACDTCRGYDFELGTDGWIVQISDGLGKNVDSVLFPSGRADLRIGRWTHLAGVIDRSARQLYFYVDGNLEGMDALAQTDLNSTTDLQFSTDFNDSMFRGAIDEGRIYRGALSAGWIAAEVRNLTDRDRFLQVGPEETVD